MKRIVLIAAVVLLVASLAAVKPPAAHAQDSAAVAVNTKDGTSIFRLAFKIIRVNQQVVDNSNVAFAFASCSECEAIALSFMAVLIFSDPDEVLTANQAWAINWECTECLAFAWAVQSVMTTGGPVHFTADGNRRLAELREELRRMLESLDDVEIPETVPEKCLIFTEEGREDELRLCVALVDLTAEFRDILATELVPPGPPQDEEVSPEEEEETATIEEPTTTTTTETTPTTTETTP
jgi:putative peptide zinc metalloprotease protein